MEQDLELLPFKESNDVEISIGILKGIIGAIPTLGTFLNETLFDIRGRIYQDRINSLVIALSDKVDKIKTLNIGYLNSADFFDLTQTLVENNLKIKSEEKRRMLANVYIDSLNCKTISEFDRSILFFNFIMQLTPIQIDILKYIEFHVADLHEIGGYSKFYDLYKKHSSTEISQYEFKYYCNDLENKGLVSFGDGLTDYLSTEMVLALEASREPSAVVSDFGRDFIRYISE